MQADQAAFSARASGPLKATGPTALARSEIMTSRVLRERIRRPDPGREDAPFVNHRQQNIGQGSGETASSPPTFHPVCAATDYIRAGVEADARRCLRTATRRLNR